MAKCKVLINNNVICSLSQIDFDNLKLLEANLPDLSLPKEFFTELDFKAIEKYNNFLDLILEKNKGKMIMINSCLSKIKI
jgi:hypothetical protein